MIDSIKNRRSYRRFKSKPIEPGKLKEILKAAMYAPSANHIRPWDFIVVKNKEKKAKLAVATPWAKFAAEASVVIAVTAPQNASKDWVEDCSIVSEHIYLEAENQGLGSCWIQIRNGSTPDGEDSESYVREILECPDNIRVLNLMAVGYPVERKAPHDESEFNADKIHKEVW
jgi:nitroreductase